MIGGPDIRQRRGERWRQQGPSASVESIEAWRVVLVEPDRKFLTVFRLRPFSKQPPCPPAYTSSHVRTWSQWGKRSSTGTVVFVVALKTLKAV